MDHADDARRLWGKQISRRQALLWLGGTVAGGLLTACGTPTLPAATSTAIRPAPPPSATVPSTPRSTLTPTTEASRVLPHDLGTYPQTAHAEWFDRETQPPVSALEADKNYAVIRLLLTGIYTRALEAQHLDSSDFTWVVSAAAQPGTGDTSWVLLAQRTSGGTLFAPAWSVDVTPDGEEVIEFDPALTIVRATAGEPGTLDYSQKLDATDQTALQQQIDAFDIATLRLKEIEPPPWLAHPSFMSVGDQSSLWHVIVATGNQDEPQGWLDLKQGCWVTEQNVGYIVPGSLSTPIEPGDLVDLGFDPHQPTDDTNKLIRAAFGNDFVSRVTRRLQSLRRQAWKLSDGSGLARETAELWLHMLVLNLPRDGGRLDMSLGFVYYDALRQSWLAPSRGKALEWDPRILVDEQQPTQLIELTGIPTRPQAAMQSVFQRSADGRPALGFVESEPSQSEQAWFEHGVWSAPDNSDLSLAPPIEPSYELVADQVAPEDQALIVSCADWACHLWQSMYPEREPLRFVIRAGGNVDAFVAWWREILGNDTRWTDEQIRADLTGGYGAQTGYPADLSQPVTVWLLASPQGVWGGYSEPRKKQLLFHELFHAIAREARPDRRRKTDVDVSWVMEEGGAEWAGSAMCAYLGDPHYVNRSYGGFPNFANYDLETLLTIGTNNLSGISDADRYELSYAVFTFLLWKYGGLVKYQDYLKYSNLGQAPNKAFAQALGISWQQFVTDNFEAFRSNPFIPPGEFPLLFAGKLG